MKLPCAILILLLLASAGCATEGKFDAKLRTWKGQDVDTVVRWWGQPDATEKLSSGNHMYVYARLHHPLIAFGDTEAQTPQADSKRTLAATDVYIHCSSYFEIDPQGKVVSTYFRGDDCSSKD